MNESIDEDRVNEYLTRRVAEIKGEARARSGPIAELTRSMAKNTHAALSHRYPGLQAAVGFR